MKSFKRGIVEVKQNNHRNNILYVDGKIQFNEFNKNIEYTEISFTDDLNQLSNKNLKVLNVGLGAGYTLKHLLEKDFIKEVETVEIYMGVIKSLKKFNTHDFIINNKKSTIVNKDITKYVKSYVSDKYNAVVIDVCHPDLSCSKNVFSFEFFKDLSKIITEDAMILLWYYTPSYVMNGIDLCVNLISDVKTLFKYVEVYYTKNNNGCYFYISNNKNETTNNKFEL